MRFKLTYLLFAIWPLAGLAQCIIPPEKVFVSLDGSKSIKLLYFDRVLHYSITDEKTGKVSILEDPFGPVFAIAWSHDSKSVYVVEHVARGILVQILHLAKNGWKQYTIGGPETRDSESMVLDWKIQRDYLTLVCKVGLERANGTFYAFYVGTFDVNPSTGEISNLKKKPITYEEALNLKSKFPPD